MGLTTEMLTLDQVCSVITDGAHASPASVLEGMPMASVKDLTSSGINLSSCRRIARSDFDVLVRQGCRPQVNDVLIAKDGATALDTVCEVREDLEVVLLSSVAILRPNPSVVHSTYLRHYLDAPATRAYMKGAFISGAAIPRVVLKDLKRSLVALPPLAEQRRIAGILSAYDDLIENCQRRIRILEEMARRLYRDWFVHFRYPGHESIPLVDSPLGPIPQGWEVKTLGDVCRLTMGQSPKSEFYNSDGEGLPFHQGVTDFGERFPSDRLYCTAEGRLAEQGDILFSVRAPVGRLNIAPKRLILGRGLSAIRHKTDHQAFLWEQLKAQFTSLDMIGNGAIFASVTKADMEAIKLIAPSAEIEERADQLLAAFHEEIGVLSSQATNLRRTRDLLLPRLLKQGAVLSSR